VTADLIDLARAGDGEAFRQLVGPYERELQVHCYRMLGSVQDAEDAMQDALLAAWQGIAGFEGRASVRTWLYRVTTSRCLNVRRSARRRQGTMPPGPPPPEPTRLGEVTWLEPCPDDLLEGLPAAEPGPEASYEAREAISLAFITAVQRLPPRQRAVLILRDVLGWPAAEVADLLGTSTAAVNSALQRARQQLRTAAPEPDELTEPDAAAERALLNRYATAFERADVAALTDLLARDATFEMPPITTWFAGRENIGAFLAARVLTEPGRFRLIPVAANGQPGFGTYMRDESGRLRAHGIQVLTIVNGRIRGVVSFNDPSLLAAFGLPGLSPEP
jgi:RNA polymerase sigma-70 factor (ECF subfamily)